MLALSCAKNSDEPCNPSESAESGNFLNDLSVGDKIYYSMLIGENYFNGNVNEYSYSGDTLELEIREISTDGVLIFETITPNSNMMSDSLTYYWYKDSVYVNTWRIEGDSLFITSDPNYATSHLIQTTRLKFSDYSEQQVDIIGWRTSFNYSESNAQLFATNYSLFNHLYDSLSVYIHNEPMSYDGNGSTTVYSKSFGIVRSSVYGWWSQSGYGWDRIEY